MKRPTVLRAMLIFLFLISSISLSARENVSEQNFWISSVTDFAESSVHSIDKVYNFLEENLDEINKSVAYGDNIFDNITKFKDNIEKIDEEAIVVLLKSTTKGLLILEETYLLAREKIMEEDFGDKSSFESSLIMSYIFASSLRDVLVSYNIITNKA